MFKRIDHVEIVPSDYERSIAFYTEVFGFTVRERVPVGNPPLREIVFLELGGTVLELLDLEEPAEAVLPGPRVGYRMMAIEVDNIDDALAYLTGKGVEVSRASYPSAGGWRAEVLDPDGLAIEIRQW
ncbi:MAG: VOC family protein [Actinobacteria bacterium]|nr:VOC family protein [Actinomycetota bacterium]